MNYEDSDLAKASLVLEEVPFVAQPMM